MCLSSLISATSTSAVIVSPVLLGDTITAEVEVAEMRDDKHIIKLNTVCKNQDGKVVVSGVATVKHD